MIPLLSIAFLGKSALSIDRVANDKPSSNYSSHKYQSRRDDWRDGAVVYQIFVDRFVPPKNAKAKLHLYPGHKLKSWSELPRTSVFDQKHQIWPHCYEFWGGDLQGIRSKLNYVGNIADAVYLTPIFKSSSNHKYDTEDYFKIDPQFGSQKDLRQLIQSSHRQGLKIILDGVFNHIGLSSPLFQEALKNPVSKHRSWFYIGSQYPLAYRVWSGVRDMPGWRLEGKGAQGYLWENRDSVVRHYLHQGIDGWRLDVGFEIGLNNLHRLTMATHETKPGSLVVGEINGYPADWFPNVDGTFNFFMMTAAKRMLSGDLEGGQVGKMYEEAVQDAGLDNLLKCWLLTDNHDTPRLAQEVPNLAKRNLLHALQLTLPGSPCLYYGSELGMTGGNDPEDRAPMRWDLVNSKNTEYVWVKRLLAIRKSYPALRYGDYKSLETKKLLAFCRTTDRIREDAIVIVNPTNEAVKETMNLRIGRVMSWGDLKDRIAGATAHSVNGLLEILLKPNQVMILTPITSQAYGYAPYNRIP